MRTLFNRAVLCPMCGKRAKKNTYTHTIGFGKLGGSKEPYKGNMIVLKTNYSNFTMNIKAWNVNSPKKKLKKGDNK